MATDAVPSQASHLIARGWWWRLVVRAGLALLAFWLLALGNDRFQRWPTTSDHQQLDNSLWFAAIGLIVVAGVVFGLATWLPFTRLHYLPSRLLLALFASLPLIDFWWRFIRPQPEGPFEGFRWFDELQFHYVFAVLVGIAIASGVRARKTSAEIAELDA